MADEEKKTKKTNQREVDQYCSLSNAQVHQDYDCMLNQTNIGQNNNKYYVIQMLDCSGSYYVWNRWGRVVRIPHKNTVCRASPSKII